MDGAEILKWQELVREVILAAHVQDYIVRLVLATHPNGQFAPPITNQYIRWGASPRARKPSPWPPKSAALLDGRYNVSFEDVRRVSLPAMRHRIILNFEAQAEGIEPDKVLVQLLEQVPKKLNKKSLSLWERARVRAKVVCAVYSGRWSVNRLAAIRRGA